MNKMQHTHLNYGNLNPANHLQNEKGDFQLRQRAHVQYSSDMQEKHAVARDVETQLIREYPHGVPVSSAGC